MKKLKPTIATLILVAVGSILLPFIDFNSSGKPEAEKPQKVQVVTTNVVQTNSLPSSSSNEVDRALNNKPAQNMDWFIQGSTYIWDDWKIK